MTEKTFCLADVVNNRLAVPQKAKGECDCLSCSLAAAFALHLGEVRFPELPRPFTIHGHHPLLCDEGSITVPHFVLCTADGRSFDAVVWEAFKYAHYELWAPPGGDRETLSSLVASIPGLIAIRQQLRTGTTSLAGSAGSAIATGRYPSVRFFLEFWSDIVEPNQQLGKDGFR